MPKPRQERDRSSWSAFTNGFVAWLFAVTGPVAILLSVALTAGLDAALVNSWILASLVVSGLLSIGFSVAYRQPIGLAWTIPGAVLLGPALGHLAFSEVVGAFIATGALLVILGVTGWARAAMAFVPMPLVMAMVAGIFLPFGLDIVGAFTTQAPLALLMVGAFLAAAAVHRVGGVIPPILAALLAGAGGVALMHREVLAIDTGLQLARPVLVTPAFTIAGLLELVVPLALTVVAIQNAQGLAVLRNAGYEPPEDRLTTACGVGSLVVAPFGAVSVCVTGPVNAILNSSGPLGRRWIGGVVFGVLHMAFGVLAPTAVALALSLPTEFIALLGGLALLPVLTAALGSAFGGRCRLGALTTFLVTLSGVTLLRVSAAFWGLVLGLVVSWLCERSDLREARAA